MPPPELLNNNSNNNNNHNKSLSDWSGWKLGIDEALEQAGGVMSWQELCKVVVAKYQALTTTTQYQALTSSGKADRKLLGRFALASIPPEYLSRHSSWVRLPGTPVGSEPWLGRRLEILRDVEGVVLPSVGWVTEQVGPKHVVVVFDGCWTVEPLKLPELWHHITPDAAMKRPTRCWRVLTDLGVRAATPCARPCVDR
ncbi:unnamed protein product [Polarella glacialis]|uniref:Uncharacterized protein n=1 Tax=Polarella glacialis TaxID=89957 RepID=A0A813DHS4_POLGL|nr:unnamed protein product [Polarella glacialis]